MQNCIPRTREGVGRKKKNTMNTITAAIAKPTKNCNTAENTDVLQPFRSVVSKYIKTTM